MSKRLISLFDLKGAMAFYAVAQHPYSRPDGLFDVIDEMKRLSADWEHATLRWFNYEEVEPWLNQLKTSPIAAPILLAWNTPKIDSGSMFVAVDGYDGPSPERDFIDIDALFRNVSVAVWNSAAEFEKAA